MSDSINKAKAILQDRYAELYASGFSAKKNILSAFVDDVKTELNALMFSNSIDLRNFKINVASLYEAYELQLSNIESQNRFEMESLNDIIAHINTIKEELK